MWSTTNYRAVFGSLVGDILAYFVLFSSIYNFPVPLIPS